MLDILYTTIPKFFTWLSNVYVVPDVSLLTFIVSSFVLSVIIYVLLPFNLDK